MNSSMKTKWITWREWRDAQLSSVQFSSVQSLSRVQLFAIPWMRHARTPCPSPTPGSYWLMPFVSAMPSSHLILCHPLLLQTPIPPSIRVFSSESTLLMRWPKYWSFSFQRQSFQWKLISFKIDCWIPLQSKFLSRVFSSTIFQKHPFCAAQLSSQSNPHIHTWPLGKAIALNRRTFLDKVMSLLFNILSNLDIIFLPKSKRLLISWLQWPLAVMLEPPKGEMIEKLNLLTEPGRNTNYKEAK